VATEYLGQVRHGTRLGPRARVTGAAARVAAQGLSSAGSFSTRGWLKGLSCSGLVRATVRSGGARQDRGVVERFLAG
jgi:hypothetical protein